MDGTNVRVSKPPKRSRGASWVVNLLLIIGIIIAVGLFVWAEQERRATESKLKQTAQELQEIKRSTNRQGEEVAKEVLEKLRKIIDIPTDPEPTVATIVDVEALKKTNDFYSSAKNGDHLVITNNRAILYDAQRNVIIDVVPVQVENPDPSASPSSDAAVSPSPTATAEPTP